MRLLKLFGVAVATLVALFIGLAVLIALGVVKAPETEPVAAQPPKPSPSPRQATPRVEPPCILETDGIKHIPLFPDAASAEAMMDAVMSADALLMLDKPGVFEVIVGTRCSMVERGPKVSMVRVATGEHAASVGWGRSDWIRDGVK